MNEVDYNELDKISFKTRLLERYFRENPNAANENDLHLIEWLMMELYKDSYRTYK